MFCKNCGKELLDQAAVCTNCGVWVKDDAPKKAAEEKTETVEKAAKLSKLFGILAVSFIALTMLLVFIGIAEINMYDRGYYYDYYIWDDGLFAPAWIISWSALGLAIVSFVFGIKTKKCLGVRYLSTVIFIISIVTFFIPLFFGIA